MKTPYLPTIVALSRDAARIEIMPRFRDLADGAVNMKAGPRDLATEAGEAAARRINSGPRAAFPGCVVVGEEAASAKPGAAGGLRRR